MLLDSDDIMNSDVTLTLLDGDGIMRSDVTMMSCSDIRIDSSVTMHGAGTMDRDEIIFIWTKNRLCKISLCQRN